MAEVISRLMEAGNSCYLEFHVCVLIPTSWSVITETCCFSPRNLKWFYKKFYVKMLFIPWMNISNFKKVKYLHMIWIHMGKFWHYVLFLFLLICIIYLSVKHFFLSVYL